LKNQKKGEEMKILLGGIVALIIGVIGLFAWWTPFLLILKGIIPILLVIGGVVAVYLGVGDLKTSAASSKSEEKKES
jgi:cytochrome c oxidase assembly factor CtaG